MNRNGQHFTKITTKKFKTPTGNWSVLQRNDVKISQEILNKLQVIPVMVCLNAELYLVCFFC